MFLKRDASLRNKLAEQAIFFRVSTHIVNILATILNFSCSGRLERERKFYPGGENGISGW